MQNHKSDYFLSPGKADVAISLIFVPFLIVLKKLNEKLKMLFTNDFLNIS